MARLGPSHSDDAKQCVQALTAGPLTNPDGAAVVEVYPDQMLSADALLTVAMPSCHLRFERTLPS
ncbi:hypothetical protein OKW43_002828 [Paraburkholderia sp. WC7.3g]